MNMRQNEPGDAPEGELHFRVPAVATRLTALRHALADWARQLGLAPQDCHDLTLASYEAMANTVEHAYPNHAKGILDIRAHRDTDRRQASVVVTDYGSWKSPQPTGGRHGRGLSLIRSLASTAIVTPTANGTTVSMSWPLPARPSH
jgi:serine/threonine-protein kinase RsbW